MSHSHGLKRSALSREAGLEYLSWFPFPSTGLRHVCRSPQLLFIFIEVSSSSHLKSSDGSSLLLITNSNEKNKVSVYFLLKTYSPLPS